MRSILTDIAEAARGVVPARMDPVRDARNAVLATLQLLIGTRRGSVSPACDFGIDDPTAIFHDYPGSVDAFCEAFVRAIARHEPRLKNLSVKHVPSADLLLRIDVEASLVTAGRSVPVRFTSRIDGARNAEVS